MSRLLVGCNQHGGWVDRYDKSLQFEQFQCDACGKQGHLHQGDQHLIWAESVKMYSFVIIHLPIFYTCSLLRSSPISKTFSAKLSKSDIFLGNHGTLVSTKKKDPVNEKGHIKGATQPA